MNLSERNAERIFSFGVLVRINRRFAPENGDCCKSMLCNAAFCEQKKLLCYGIIFSEVCRICAFGLSFAIIVFFVLPVFRMAIKKEA